jgi:hypothetical protein
MTDIRETNIDNYYITEYNEELEKETIEYLKKINEDIGFYWWKYYTYCVFWSNISVPINLTITILTALTTGQTATGSLINNETSTIFGIVVLIVSIFNTFFRPTQQLNENEICKKKWAEFGTKFEFIYYAKEKKISDIEALFKEISGIKRDTTNNYCIDLFFIISQKIFIRDNITWINKKVFKKKMRGETTDSDNLFII